MANKTKKNNILISLLLIFIAFFSLIYSISIFLDNGKEENKSEDSNVNYFITKSDEMIQKMSEEFCINDDFIKAFVEQELEADFFNLPVRSFAIKDENDHIIGFNKVLPNHYQFKEICPERFHSAYLNALNNLKEPKIENKFFTYGDKSYSLSSLTHFDNKVSKIDFLYDDNLSFYLAKFHFKDIETVSIAFKDESHFLDLIKTIKQSD